MKTIDFLPEHYRQRALLRRARAWWGICAAIFGAVIAVSSGSQAWLYRSMQVQLAEVEPECHAARELDARFAKLRQEVGQREETANLLAYLRHPWPRSQIIAALVSNIPASVELTGFEIQAEESSAETEGVAPRRRNAAKKDTASVTKLAPRVEDLAKLRASSDNVTTIVALRGATADDTQLHQYVQTLSEHPLFASAQLVSINAMETASKEHRSNFVVRVKVCPGFGQPGGPDIVPKSKSETRSQTPVTSEAAHKTSAGSTEVKS